MIHSGACKYRGYLMSVIPPTSRIDCCCDEGNIVSIERKVSIIDKRIDQLAYERDRLLMMPEDIYEHGDVIWFQKTWGGSTAYTYAALKIHESWYLTGNKNLTGPRRWDELMDFIGDNEIWAAAEWEQVQ